MGDVDERRLHHVEGAGELAELVGPGVLDGGDLGDHGPTARVAQGADERRAAGSLATSWALSDTARTRRVIDRVRSNAISAARSRATSVIADAEEGRLLQRVGFGLGVGHDLLGELVADGGDARDGLVELGRVERHERAVCRRRRRCRRGGSWNRSGVVPIDPRGTPPTRRRERRSRTRRRWRPSRRRAARPGRHPPDRPTPASRRSTARRRWRSARSRRARRREQGAAELGVAGFAGSSRPRPISSRSAVSYARTAAMTWKSSPESTATRPVLRALVAEPILTTIALLSPMRSYDLTQVAHRAVGGAPGVDDRGLVAGVGDPLLGLDRLDRGDERFPRRAQLGATAGLVDIVEVVTDRQREQRADGHQQWQCGDEQFGGQRKATHASGPPASSCDRRCIGSPTEYLEQMWTVRPDRG